MLFSAGFFLINKIIKCALGNPLFEEDRESEHEQMSFQSWMDDSDLRKGSIGVLDNDEKLFWEDFIAKYLKPLKTDKEHEKQVSFITKKLYFCALSTSCFIF